VSSQEIQLKNKSRSLAAPAFVLAGSPGKAFQRLKRIIILSLMAR